MPRDTSLKVRFLWEKFLFYNIANNVLILILNCVVL